jgi:hypothetical protein
VDALRALACEVGRDPLVDNKQLTYDKSLARANLINYISTRLSEGAVADGDDEDAVEDALPPDVLEAWLKSTSDEWPFEARPPPANAAEALDPNGPWGAAARGVEVRRCSEPQKGRGVFAARGFREGELIGVYWGEKLTQRQYAVRHGWRHGEQPTHLSADEIWESEERQARLCALSFEEGLPMGGHANGGAYIFSTLLAATEPERLPPGLGKKAIYIDAEDGTRSNWCRYINHAHIDLAECNLNPHTNALRELVWFTARRQILAGEEICFSYGKVFNDSYGKKHTAVEWHTKGS